ncbi:MurR/RpiR family transcriptional regulator [Kribbella sindirgiensis]|uniref:MurR/RpiR family transcriptional regulator n=1 Tax=Kribbella sindirgiensis TaxID=1124744 RepID=A0A4R0IJ62_9ACTN|nr:MurR/RpiR family transcriptional regulator [Kribbella sindirgiensis]TCC32204.1 MurR/RpiR family transcriptional regulator [Kribbella sindirgiensis]
MDADSVVDDSLYGRATRIGPDLPDVLGKVATFFALHPDRVAGLSVQEIAAAIGTSDASVIRTAKALGYSGMKTARQAALELVNQRANPGAILQRRMYSTADGSHLRQVVNDTARAVEQFAHQMDEIDWDGLVTAVAEADRVFCYGLAPTGYIADYLAFILARIGVDARASRASGLLLADDLAQLRPGTTVVVFAPVRQFDEVAATVRTAKTAGASVILITEAIGMPVRSEADFVVTTSPTSLTSASDAGIPLLVSQALMSAVAARHPSRALDAMDRLNHLRPTVTRQSAQLSAERLGIPTTSDADPEIGHTVD